MHAYLLLLNALSLYFVIQFIVLFIIIFIATLWRIKMNNKLH